jgi:hypothetical protein
MVQCSLVSSSTSISKKTICQKWFKYSWMWRCVVWIAVLDDSKDHNSFIFWQYYIGNFTYTIHTIFLRGCSSWPAWPWKWKHCDTSKRRKLFAQRHSVTSQKTWIFSNTATRTSYLPFLFSPSSRHRIYNLS